MSVPRNPVFTLKGDSEHDTCQRKFPILDVFRRFATLFHLYWTVGASNTPTKNGPHYAIQLIWKSWKTVSVPNFTLKGDYKHDTDRRKSTTLYVFQRFMILFSCLTFWNVSAYFIVFHLSCATGRRCACMKNCTTLRDSAGLRVLENGYERSQKPGFHTQRWLWIWHLPTKIPDFRCFSTICSTVSFWPLTHPTLPPKMDPPTRFNWSESLGKRLGAFPGTRISHSNVSLNMTLADENPRL